MAPATVLLLALALAARAGAQACEVTVETDLGLVVGERVELLDGGVTPRPVHRFLGIPYSQPPIGEHRWRPPRDPVPFERGWFKATEWPDSCANLNRSPNPLCRTCSTRSNPPIEPNSEDCLRLNVFAPDGSTPESGLPVMVYVHGGGGTVGSGKMYSNSSSLVHKGVVLVTINYRLGILGFLAHRLLSEEQGGISGNYQVMDMVKALEWVKAHIRGFGGDPDRVTVFGQSFGGSAMQYLMLSPKAKGKYDRIISQSGGGVGDYSTQSAVESGTGAQLFSAIGCATLECARGKTWEEVVDSGVGRSQPCVDRDGWIPRQPLDALRAGAVNAVPAIFGHDVVENHLNDYFTQKPYGGFVDDYADEAKLRSAASSQLGSGCTSERCKAEYPTRDDGMSHALGELYPESGAFPNGYERYSNLRVDKSNGMSTFQWAQEYARTAPAFRYVFTQGAEGSPTLGPFGAGHLVENLYVFGDPQIIGPGHEMTEGELATVAETTELWAEFARSGTPGTKWPQFDDSRVGVTLVIGPDGRADAVEGWRAPAYQFFSLWANYCGSVYPCPVGGVNRSKARPPGVANE